uniref:Parathyroid hormone/parathyroid hormone-related peptide receptor n=1 Tax=Eptatretus burgeri TaxID=7764 RepID=A0A8C4QPY0_EPTBU
MSKEEQVKILLEAEQQCHLTIGNNSINTFASRCRPEWDGLICWPSSSPGTLVSVQCPAYIYDFNHRGFAHRTCDATGRWKFLPDLNKTWANYTECAAFLRPEKHLQEKKVFDRLYVIYTVGYSMSLSSLSIALFILGYFKRLHCTRNYIHMHLFMSFMFRAISIFVKDAVLYDSSDAHDSPSALALDSPTRCTPTSAATVGPDQMSPIYAPRHVGCKVAVTIFLYFLATNHFWVLVEGLYLHGLVYRAFHSEPRHLLAFNLLGWGVPAVLVLAWVAMRLTFANTQCWDTSAGHLKWIYQFPILSTVLVNFFLFVHIVRVLARKLREGHSTQNAGRQQYRKLVRSMLVLMPLFGVHSVVFMAMPYTTRSDLPWLLQMHYEMFFNSFQGFLVATIYCFCNGEVQAEVKKTWKRWNLGVDLKRQARGASLGLGPAPSASQATSSVSTNASSRAGILPPPVWCITPAADTTTTTNVMKTLSYHQMLTIPITSTSQLPAEHQFQQLSLA